MVWADSTWDAVARFFEAAGQDGMIKIEDVYAVDEEDEYGPRCPRERA